MMDFNDDNQDSFLDIVSKGLVIFMMILVAFLLSWVFGNKNHHKDNQDSFLDIVSKGLVIFMMFLVAFLLSWVFGKI